MLSVLTRFANELRGLGVSLMWSGLLLGGLVFFALGATVPRAMPRVMAAGLDMPTVAFDAATYTMTEGDGNGAVLLSITPASSSLITVTVSSSAVEGGAEAGIDYAGLRRSLAIAPGTQVVTLSVTLLDDLLIEGEEQLRLTLGNLRGATLGTITETLVSIEDNDLVHVHVGVSDVVVDEGAGSVSLVITQSITSTVASVVGFRTINGSATAPEDYAATSGSVTIPPGSTQAMVTIQLTPDEEVEPTESFVFQLENPLNVQLANTTATVTILDDDEPLIVPAPQFEIAPAEASEADGTLSFVVSLSSRSPQTVTVEYATADGTAIAPADYLSETGVLIIPPGNLTATVAVSLAHDQAEEPDETLYLVLTNPSRAILETTQAVGTIRNSAHDAQAILFLPGLKR